MEVPYLIGYQLDRAIKEFKIKCSTYNVKIVETIPPYSKKEKSSECRVVRQRVFDNNIEITTSYF